MISHTVHYFITMKILELQVWTIVVWMIMLRVTCIQDERIYLVKPNNIQRPIIKMSVMAIIEEHLGIECIIEKPGGKMGHGFKPATAIHITRQRIVDDLITGYVVM